MEKEMNYLDDRFREYDRNVEKSLRQIEKEFEPDVSVFALIKEFFVKLFK